MRLKRRLSAVFILFRIVFRLRVSRHIFCARNMNPCESVVCYSVFGACYCFPLQTTGEIVSVLAHLFLILVQAARFIKQK
jgi:hypothetical protein